MVSHTHFWVADKLFECIWPFLGGGRRLVFKGLRRVDILLMCLALCERIEKLSHSLHTSIIRFFQGNYQNKSYFSDQFIAPKKIQQKPSRFACNLLAKQKIPPVRWRSRTYLSSLSWHNWEQVDRASFKCS